MSVLRENWVPTKIFLRGWSPFVASRSERVGISTDEAGKLVERIRAAVSSNDAACLKKWSAPFFRNFQITIDLNGVVFAENEMFELAKRISAVCKSKGVDCRGSVVYASVEQPEWKRTRNRVLKGAEQALVKHCPMIGSRLKLDWAAGVIYDLPPSHPEGVLIGSYVRISESWSWVSSAVTELGVSVASLEESRAEFLNADF
jgi:hypothetical protein